MFVMDEFDQLGLVTAISESQSRVQLYEGQRQCQPAIRRAPTISSNELLRFPLDEVLRSPTGSIRSG